MRTRQIRVSGRVQGVGYRYALRDEAPAPDGDHPYSDFEIRPTA